MPNIVPLIKRLTGIEFELYALLCERDRAIVAIKQACTHFVFQLANTSRQGGVAHMGLLAGTTKMQAFGQSQKLL